MSAKDRTWINYSGQIPFILLGVNGALGSTLAVELAEFDIGTLPMVIILGCAGTLGGLLAGQIWTYLLLFFGKIWKGQGTKSGIETVLSLSLIPEVIKSIYLIGQIIVGDRHLVGIQVSGLLTIICLFLTARILIIGLSTVQKFSYGLSILNVVLPQVVIGAVYLAIHV